MLLRFTKMHGLGNDFMVLDLVSQHAHIQPKHAKQWGSQYRDRFRSIVDRRGPDQSGRGLSLPDLQFRRFGSGAMRQWRSLLCPFRAGQALDHQAPDPRRNQERRHRTRCAQRRPDQRRHGTTAPGTGGYPISSTSPGHQLYAGRRGRQVELAAISMGNPHAVLRVDDINSAPVHELGPKIEHHPRFPARVNVGFLQVLTVNARSCGCGNVAPGKPRPAAPAPAPLQWPRSARGGWIRRY